MEQILSTIGLAQKAGLVAVGEEPVGSAARSKHARVILTAKDAAPGTVRRACSFAETGSCLVLSIPADKETLGRALGRTSCAMAAITDIGFAEAIVKKLAALDSGRYGDAAGTLKIKAERAARRRQEKLQHEKNQRRGKKNQKEPETHESVREEKTAERPSGMKHRPSRRPHRRREEPRFARSRPVKKGKGSGKKKKQ